MRRELSALAIDGKVVIGEGEMDAAPMLFFGEKVGTGSGPRVDIAVDPLEGATLCAKNMPGAIATLAMAQDGTLLHAADIYMDKIAVGPGYPKNVVDLDAPAEENIVKGECLFAATGVTDGRMLRGVQFGREVIETETVVMRSTSGTIRWIRAEHRQLGKFR